MKINKKQQHRRQINKHIKQDWGDRNSGKSAAPSGSFAVLEITAKSIHQPPVFPQQRQLDRNQAWFSTTSTSKCFCQVKCLVVDKKKKKSGRMKNVWRNWWKLRLLGLFNIQVITPSEMYCKWTACLTSLSASLVVSTSLFSTSVGTKTTHAQEDNLNKAVFQRPPFLWPSETNRINLLPGQRCSS